MEFYMKGNKEKIYNIYHTLLSLGLTWAFILTINYYYELKIHMIICALCSITASVLIYLFDLYRRNAITYLILISSFPIMALFLWINKINTREWIGDLLQWYKSYDASSDLYNASYAYFTIFIIALAAALIFYLLMKKTFTKVMLVLLLIFILIVFSIKKIVINKAVIAICIFYILSILIEISGYMYSKKYGIEDKRASILYLAPVCLIISLGAVLLPSKSEPIQWQYFKDIYYNVKNTLDIWFDEIELLLKNDSGEFSLSLTGFNDDHIELGSSEGLVEDNKIALLVSGNNDAKPIYLIGSVSDTYTGYSWEKGLDEKLTKEDDYLLDYAELIYALSRLDLETLETKHLIERRYLKIIFNNIKTKSCFYPLKSSWLKGDRDDSKPDMKQAYMIFPRVMGQGTSYDIVFYDLNLMEDAFIQMLREADDFSYEQDIPLNKETASWLELNILNMDNIGSDKKIWKSYEELKIRAEKIYDNYLALPETLPNKVRDLALEIAKDYDNSFDKLKAIEAYLQKYPYTLNPGKLPKDEDFVSYFLFDNRKGYCTSFASAMAVLGRCIGIPTRYIEGFIVDYNGEYQNNLLEVKNSSAHAWAEAYITGVGWIPFEATFKFNDRRYVEWPEKIDEDRSKSESKTSVDHMAEDIIEELYDGDEIVEIIDKVIDGEEEKTTHHNIFIWIIVIIVSFVTLILLFLIYYSILLLRYKRAFNDADNNKKMYMLFLRILWLLRVEGFTLQPQETIVRYAQRVNEYFKLESMEFRDVAKIYMDYRYGGVEVTEKEGELIYRYTLELESNHRKKVNKLRFILQKLAFLSKSHNKH